LRKHSAVLIGIFLFCPFATYAQSTNQAFQLDAGRLHASIEVSDPPAERIIRSVRDGLESEVQYNVRVYEYVGGFLGFFGDKLVDEYQRSYRARWDEFSGDFVLTSNGGSPFRTASARTFLTALFTLPNVDTGIRLKQGKQYYVLSDVRIQIVKLVPPLTMIAPFLAQRQMNTQWVKTEIIGR
jgi:hypothetical protein